MKKRISRLGKIVVYIKRFLALVGEYEIKKQMGEVTLREK